MTARRLAAILAADVVGYSRLIGADEAGTLGRLRALRSEVVEPLVGENGGRVFKTTGDGLLAEFSSVVQALRCAIRVQERLRGGQMQGQLQVRIGVHQGDVVVEGDDLLGDGVNVAARLEGLAEPGGICISGRVREDAAGKLSLEVEDLGEPELKNIAQRHRVFRVRLSGAAERPALALPDKPSLAVLPFQNMSGDPEQEYFADGMVEEIITALSRFRQLFVIARNSSFTYKGRAVDVKQVGRELGVRYVLEGSVRKAGNRVRITGQLIDATTGAHIWADRFDGTLEDIFDLQDRVTASVVGAIEPKIQAAEIQRAQRKPPDDLQAYDLVLRALPLMPPSAADRDRLEEAQRLLRRAIEIDPTYAPALALLAHAFWQAISLAFVPGSTAANSEITGLAWRAVQYGEDDPEVLAHAGSIIAKSSGDLFGGIALIEKAISLNPNSIRALTMGGQARAFAGDPDTAIAYLERAARLNPLADGPWRDNGFAMAHFVAGRYEAAATFAEKSSRAAPGALPPLPRLAASLALLGRIDEARAVVDRIRAIVPDFTVARMRTYNEIVLNNAYKTPGAVEALYEGLRLAGLPE